MIKIVLVKTKPQLNKVRILFKEYASMLGFDLSFQNFDKEFSELPGEYEPPDGRLLLALENGEAVGCVGLRKFELGVCEMKRMYVRKKYQSRGIGRKLAWVVIEEAKKIGYHEMRLDTVPWMKEAIALYISLGFKEIKPYRFNPITGTKYFSLRL